MLFDMGQYISVWLIFSVYDNVIHFISTSTMGKSHKKYSPRFIKILEFV